MSEPRKPLELWAIVDVLGVVHSTGPDERGAWLNFSVDHGHEFSNAGIHPRGYKAVRAKLVIDS